MLSGMAVSISSRSVRFLRTGAWLPRVGPALRTGSNLANSVRHPCHINEVMACRLFASSSKSAHSAQHGRISAGDDMAILAQALHSHGLIDDPSGMDASVVSADRKDAILWPATQSMPIDQLSPAHKLIYSNIATAGCVVGIATEDVKAVARMPQGLQIVSQSGAHFYGSAVFSKDLTTAALKIKERERLRLLLLGDEGKAYVVGSSPGVAFTLAYYLQKICRLQLLVGTHDVVPADAEVWQHAAQQTFDPQFHPGVEWPAVKAGVQRNHEARLMQESNQGCDAEESTRVALAKCHRELSKKGYDELTWNHCSALVGDDMLVTPGDRLWDDIMPTDFIFDSKNVTANILHSAIYDSTSAKAVVHTHAPGIEAVSCIKGHLNEETASEFAGRVAYHDWQGLSDDHEECKVIGDVLARHPDAIALIARNHGAFTWGNSVEEALDRHVKLEAACLGQLQKPETLMTQRG